MEFPYFAGANSEWCKSFGTLAVFVNINLSSDPAIQFLGIYSRKMSPYIYAHRIRTRLFQVILFIIAKSWELPKCSSIEWINKLWCVHIMEFYSAVKKNELMVHNTIWMNIIHIKLNEKP